MSKQELQQLEKALQKLLYSQKENLSQEGKEKQDKKIDKMSKEYEKAIKDYYIDYEIEQEANDIELKNYYIAQAHKYNYYNDDETYDIYNNYY